jgi:hypothetical protein
MPIVGNGLGFVSSLHAVSKRRNRGASTLSPTRIGSRVHAYRRLYNWRVWSGSHSRAMGLCVSDPKIATEMIVAKHAP